MSEGFLPVKEVGGSMAVTLCPRCGLKYYYGELKQDPNTKVWMCEGCVDIYDPWRLPARHAENITLLRPRPDISVAEDGGWLTTEDGSPLTTENGDMIDG